VDRDASDFLMRSLRKLHRWGVPPWFDYGVVEFTSNVILFVPLGALVARILGQRLWWGGAAAGFVLSALIELSQLAFLPARFPSVADVAANTFGAMVGALLALVFMARHEHAMTP
jgi:glycopeptide antibiotics resistance protein